MISSPVPKSLRSEKRILTLVAGLLLSGVFASKTCHADLIVSFVEAGGNVISTVDGTVDTTDLFNAGDVPETISIRPSLGTFFVGAQSGIAHEHFFVPASAGRSGPNSFGPGGFTAADSGTGSFIGFTANSGNFNLYVPEQYTSGSFISGSASYLNETFDSLGLTPGTYVWTAGNNTITATISAVPEPSFAVVAIASCGWLSMRRRRVGRD